MCFILILYVRLGFCGISNYRFGSTRLRFCSALKTHCYFVVVEVGDFVGPNDVSSLRIRNPPVAELVAPESLGGKVDENLSKEKFSNLLF